MTTLVTPAQLAAALSYPNVTDPALGETCNAANSWLLLYLNATDADGLAIDHSQHAYCVKAALEIAVDMWTSSKAAGGQPVSLDYQPAPYTMGASMLRRVAGLVAPCRQVAGMVG